MQCPSRIALYCEDFELFITSTAGVSELTRPSPSRSNKEFEYLAAPIVVFVMWKTVASVDREPRAHGMGSETVG